MTVKTEHPSERKAQLAARRAALSNAKKAELDKLIRRGPSRATVKRVLVPKPQDSPAQLSFAQQRLWFLEQLQPGTSIYNIHLAFRITGHLRIPVLKQSFNETMRRHESLRTNFEVVHEEPIQVIAQSRSLDLSIVDLEAIAEENREAAIHRLAVREVQRPFNLISDPLLRALVFRSGPQEHTLVVTVHHIISDGWSLQILIQEVGMLYQTFCAGEPSPLPELPIQYADYAYWQRQLLSGERLEEQLAYWRHQLREVSPALNLPVSRPRPATLSFRGETRSIVISAELTERLRALARKEQATLFMMLLASFQMLLARYSGQDDIVIGAPVEGRQWVETEGLIGFFANTLVLRTNLRANPTVEEVLRRVRQAVFEAQSHSDVPFERIVEDLRPERSLSHSPLFQVMFVLQNVPRNNLTSHVLRLSPLDLAPPVERFDLTLSVAENGTGLAGLLSYSTDLFEGTVINRMIGHWQQILKAVTDDPRQKIGNLCLLVQGERQQVLTEWNRTAKHYPSKFIHELIEEQALKTPTAIALEYENKCLTYADLNGRANQLAHYLRVAGVGPEFRVGVCMFRSVEMVVALLGILKAGGAYVPLDPDYPPERLGYMLQDSELAFLLTQDSLASRLPRPVKMLKLDSQWDLVTMAKRASAPIPLEPENLAYVIYTSGSTGNPKGAMNTHGGISNRLLWMQEAYGLGIDDCVLQKTPFSFDVSVWEFFWPLMTGARLVIAKPRGHQDPEYLAETIEKHKVTTVHFVPSMLAVFLDSITTEKCATLRRVICSGEALNVETASKCIQRIPAALYNLYGPTEAAIDVTHARCNQDHIANGIVIGKPIANTRTYVLDEEMAPCPVGIPGELYLAGAGLARGYLNRNALTAEKFVPDPFSAMHGERLYRTGDWVRWRDDGSLEFIGRRDDQVKIRGHRIELAEIESALRQHPEVKEAIVVAREHSGDKRLVGYIVPRDQSPLNSDLQKFLSEKLPDYMVPGSFVSLTALPLSANGKLDRRLLPEPGKSRPESEKAFMTPRTLIEEIVAVIWAEVLGLEEVGREDNFFNLGGYSLLATRAVLRIRETLNIELPVRTLFEAPTLAGLAEQVETLMRGSAPANMPPLSPVLRDGVLPLSYAQQRLWFLDQLLPGSSAYNIPEAVQLESAINLVALEQAMGEVIRRHEILRTIFPKMNGQPAQLISSWQQLSLPLVDLSRLSKGEQATASLALAQEEARKPFNLSQGPLLRVGILRLDSASHVQLATMHHIISDGWSMGILRQEVHSLYQAFASGTPSFVPELTIQYVDYAQWQRRWLQGDALQKEVSFWKQELAGAPTVLELETDHLRPTLRTAAGEQCRFLLSKQISRSLREFSRKENATLFMTLMSAFQGLLSRYTGQSDFLVGSPVAGRSRLELESLIGFFVNMVAFRADLRNAPSFRELLRRVRESALRSYAHEDLPFDKLVEELQPQRTVGRNPLFQVILAFQNPPEADIEVAGVNMPALNQGTGETKFDLELYLWEMGDRVAGCFVYSPELFESATIQRMTEHFQSLLERSLSDPDVELSKVSLMNESDRRILVREWNQMGAEFPAGSCIHELFEERAGATPDAIAISNGHEQISYGELNRRAGILARYLRQQGIGPEVVAAICMERRLELVIGMLAIVKAGGAYLPLDPNYPPERLSYMFEDAQAAILLTHQSCLDHLPKTRWKAICLDTDWAIISRESEKLQELNPRTCSDNLVYVIYTSGSTGRPKGVMVRHRGLVNLVNWHNRVYGVTPADRATQLAGISFDATGWEIWPYLSAGATVFLPPIKTFEAAIEIKQWLKEYGITHCFLPTPLAETIVPDLPPGLQLRFVLTGGDRLHRIEKDLDFQLVNHYGPTETTVLATCAAVDRNIAGLPPIGRPIANTEVYILDEHLEPVPPGITGEIYVGGEGVARGYLRQPELTAQQFLPDPFSHREGARLYRTGDLARYRADGTIDYKGRSDHQVKIRGFRIETGEVESTLKEHPDVHQALVMVRQDALGEKRLVAYVSSSNGHTQPSEGLKTYLKQRLPEYMVPSIFLFVPRMPVTQNGKVDIAALPIPDFSLTRTGRSFAPPRDPLQQQLVEIWEELLSVHPIGITDDFFELGGHSLLVVQLISRIEERIKQRVPMAALFQGATIENLSHLLREDSKTRSWSPLVPIQPNGENPPMFVVHAAGGHVLFYADLARNLGLKQPLYGLQSRETNKELTPHTQIEAMAAEYVEAVRGFQPQGPYLLGGWSMGGVIAFEMARQLRAQGQVISLLALMDSEAPAQSPPDYRWTVQLGSFALSLGFSFDNLSASWKEISSLPPMKQLNRIWSDAKKMGFVPADMTLAGFRNMFDGFKANAQILRSYAGGNYDGRVTLFRTENKLEFNRNPENMDFRDPLKGWNKWVLGGVEVFTVAGDHYTMMREPHVKTLASSLLLTIGNLTSTISQASSLSERADSDIETAVSAIHS